jgi:ABC-type Zn uptake system ZnuABC Zn-binding protein ZnuA
LRVLALALLVLALASPARPSEGVRVVTTLPELADFARKIGGARVEVTSLLTGLEDVHTYEPRMSDVRTVAGARVLVVVGLGLEEWLQSLVANAGNRNLVVVEASKGAKLIREEAAPKDKHGHRHGPANPHVWLDPANVAPMCRNILAALEAADPAGRDFYHKNLAAFLQQVDEAARRLSAEVATLDDRRFLSYHPAWPYLARGFGFQLAGVVSPSPGQEPSARALANLTRRIRAEKIRVIVTEPQLSSKLPRLLAQETGIRVVVLSDVLGFGGSKSYLEHLEMTVRTLVSALREAP